VIICQLVAHLLVSVRNKKIKEMKFTYNFVMKVNKSQLNLSLLRPAKEQDFISVIICIYTNSLYNFGFTIELPCSEYWGEHVSIPRH
jgi:hypothetical protein